MCRETVISLISSDDFKRHPEIVLQRIVHFHNFLYYCRYSKQITMKYLGRNGESFEVISITQENQDIITTSDKNQLSLMWIESDNNQFVMDSIPHTFNTNDIICFTAFHHIDLVEVKELKLLRFNRPFYCILDYDSEVGCKGILYYGSSQVPIIHPNEEELDIMKTVWKMLMIEMASRDNLQLEMLQMMLKRILILCTRIYKNQAGFKKIENSHVEIIREFNFLVESHFKEKHGVADYAALLHKSPKTLSNLFKKIGEKSPLQFIQSRIMTEARRLLRYSEKSISEVAYELGYNDVQTFSRFFKKREGVSPLDHRKMGKIA
jgi:AraC family transcriptional activator of pobA